MPAKKTHKCTADIINTILSILNLEIVSRIITVPGNGHSEKSAKHLGEQAV